MNITVKDADERDIRSLATRLRSIDAEECSAVAPHMTPEEAIFASVSFSPNAKAVIDGDGRCLTIFGIGPAGDGTGCPWLLCADDFFTVIMDKHRRMFVKECRGYLKELSKGYSSLHNKVSAMNHRAIAWLAWMGFSFGDKVIINNHPFIHFSMEVK